MGWFAYGQWYVGIFGVVSVALGLGGCGDGVLLAVADFVWISR
jgi:hypothetical protein